MKNVLILGTGRSGTSMVAGCLARAGYFMGDNLLETTHSNPKGFFEDIEVNGINEEILEPVAPKRRGGLLAPITKHRPARFQRWLVTLRPGTTIDLPPALTPRIRRLVSREPYCFKDPRFSWTLPAWRPFLKDPLLLVVFRAPTVTANSIVTECRSNPRLADLVMTQRRALRIWTATYSNILSLASQGGDWLFLHYDQVASGAAFDALEKRTGAVLDKSFPDLTLDRAPRQGHVRRRTAFLYRQLHARADFKALAS
jgi:hypothetical protein